MKITTSAALAKLIANPTEAAHFDAASKVDYPDKTRPEVVELTLQALNAKRDRRANIAALKKQSADLKLKLSKLKAAVAIKAAGLKPVAVIKPAPTAATAEVSQTVLSDTLLSLTGAAKTSFYRQHERALKIEAIKKSNPKTITI